MLPQDCPKRPRGQRAVEPEFYPGICVFSWTHSPTLLQILPWLVSEVLVFLKMPTLVFEVCLEELEGDCATPP